MRVRGAPGSQAHKQQPWGWLACQHLLKSGGGPGARPPHLPLCARTNSLELAGGHTGTKLSPHAGCKLHAGAWSAGQRAHPGVGPGEPRPVAGVSWGDALCSFPQPWQRCAGLSCMQHLLEGFGITMATARKLNRPVSMSWRQNGHKRRVPGAGLHTSWAWTAPAQDAAPGHTACGWCCAHPAGTEMVSIPGAGMSPCHPAARGHSPRSSLPENLALLSAGPCRGLRAHLG